MPVIFDAKTPKPVIIPEKVEPPPLDLSVDLHTDLATKVKGIANTTMQSMNKYGILHTRIVIKTSYEKDVKVGGLSFFDRIKAAMIKYGKTETQDAEIDITKK